MTTSQIVWIVVIALAALILIGLIVGSMRKKNQDANRERAGQLRHRADTQAAGLPDARARADQAEAQAERARLEAERAEEHSATVRAEVDQEQALHEEHIRAADRLDPDVDHRAKDYSPTVVDPAGPSDVPTDPTYADPATGRAATTPPGSSSTADDSATGGDDSATSTPATPGGSSVTLEPTDTTPRDATIGTDSGTMRHRLDGGAPEGTDQHPEENPDENTDATHRA